jgi:ATP-dependent helicase/DNAse subunit B
MAFFFERVLGLEELPEPGVEVTVLEQGQLIHRILSQFYQARPKIGGGYLHVAGDAQDNGPSPEARELLFRTTDEILKSFERRAFACQETLWQVTAELVRSRLETWLDAEVQIPSKLKLAPGEIPVPVRFEFSYGKGGMQPLVLELPNAGRIAVAGRIDRVDEIGADGFVVYDYKRKSAPEKKQILEGEDFQLIFYALAAQRLIFQERRQCKAFAYVRVGYPVSDALRAKVTDREEIEELIKRSLEHVDSHVSKMRSGRFHWAPRSCPSSTRSSCPFAYVCRYDMQRVRRRETETRPGGEEDE